MEPREYRKCIRKRIEADRELKRQLHSLIQYGSSVRGDFVEGVSDLDFFAVLYEEPDSSIPRLRNILEECTRTVDKTIVDLAWEYLKNLHDPLNKGYPFKFLTIYQRDFLDNHFVIYSEGIEGILPMYEWRSLIRWRVERLLANVERDRRNKKMLRIGAGEVIRLMALFNGASSISKDETLKKIEEIGDKEALRIFTDYLSGIDPKLPESYYIDFITERLRSILDQLLTACR